MFLTNFRTSAAHAISGTNTSITLSYVVNCDYFRSSSHRQIIDHFYQEHNGATTIQCPFCLKATTVWSSGRSMSTNVTFFLAHLQKHQKKQMAKKCSKCALWFIQKDSLTGHNKAHESCSNKFGLKSYPTPTNGYPILVPRSKFYPTTPSTSIQSITTVQKPATRTVPDNSQHKLTLLVPDKMHCKECNKNMLNADHYP